jgi:DNA-binding LacI/PurR family transcriptional regulator
MNPTIKDVAKLAGVSTKTVSNVINDNASRFSPVTRDRVLAAMKKLKYQPNRAAQFMRSGSIGIIALAVPTISNPYFAEIACEIIDAAREQGYTVLIEHTDGLAENERLLVSSSGPHTVDGVIIDPVALAEDELYRYSVNTPVVLLGERVVGRYFDHIMIDNVTAARMITEHLLDMGRRRIAIMPMAYDHPSSLFHMRYQGYAEALGQAGVVFDPQLVVGPRHTVSLSHRDGMDCMEQLLERDTQPDAIFCFNDLVALGAMKILAQRGYRVPDDIAVAGFDNITQSYLTVPALTTVSPDKKAIGRLAVSLLIDRIRGKRTGSPEQFTPGFNLVVRGTTVANR